MKKIAFISILLFATDVNASNIKGVDYSISVEDYTTDMAYDISVTSAGGVIPKTHGYCVQMPPVIEQMKLNGQTTQYYNLTALCTIGKIEIPVAVYCHTQFKNSDTSFAYFKLDAGNFKLNLSCEYKPPK